MSLPLNESNLAQVVGEDGLRRLVSGFYRRTKADPRLAPMYPMYPDGDWDGAEERLAQFLIYRFGGTDTYLQERGHPRLRQRHAPYPVDAAARDAWIENMEASLDEVGFPAEADAVLRPFLRQTADFLINRR